MMGIANIFLSDGSIRAASIMTRPEIMWQLTHTFVIVINYFIGLFILLNYFA
ncbi:MAG: hypothetical protein LBC20_03435 [Planctomycetaceae bacterium]|jgi:hypothetical protein|nr:hypothetical protein [Planctomycetaceae bacterium]